MTRHLLYRGQHSRSSPENLLKSQEFSGSGGGYLLPWMGVSPCTPRSSLLYAYAVPFWSCTACWVGLSSEETREVGTSKLPSPGNTSAPQLEKLRPPPHDHLCPHFVFTVPGPKVFREHSFLFHLKGCFCSERKNGWDTGREKNG